MRVYRIRLVGKAAQAVSAVTALADTDGVELISSEPPSIVDEDTVQLGVAVKGAADAVAQAVSTLRAGMPKGASIEIVDD